MPVPGGFVGVDVFFVVSGFVITRLLMADLDDTGRVDFARFYGRRVRRLLPALSLMLVTVTLASLALGAIGSLQRTAGTAAAAALIVANLYLYRSGEGGYFDEAPGLNPLVHTWSLSVEEQFYLFFPALLALGWRLGRPSLRNSQRNAATALVLLTCAVSFWMSVAMTGQGPFWRIASPGSFAFYSAPTRAWEFGVGAIVAMIGVGRLLSGSAARHLASASGWLLIGWAALTYGPATRFPGLSAVAPVAGTALLIAAGGGGTETVGMARVLHWPVLVRLGDLSYSWYLWHWPFIVLGRTLCPTNGWMPGVMAMLSLVPAWVSYVAVEEPLRSWRPRSPVQTVVLAVSCAFLPLLGAVALRAAIRALPRIESIATYTLATRPHLDFTAGCDNSTPFGSRAQITCAWPASTPRGHIVLIGDSNAGHLSEPVIRAAHLLGHSVELVTMSSCPFVNVVLQYRGKEQTVCREFFERSIEAMVVKPPTLVIVASASDWYIREDEWALAKPGGDEWQRSPESKGKLWAAQLESTLRTLHEAGSRLLVVHPIPRLGPWQARSCAAGIVALWPQACATSRLLDAAILERRRGLDAERASALTTGTHTLDLASDICTDLRCDAWRAGIWWYRDGMHLGVDGALALTPRFSQALADVLGLE
jgi:peptidoglycan/LPS O-acetylase OafA/YrhL